MHATLHFGPAAARAAPEKTPSWKIVLIGSMDPDPDRRSLRGLRRRALVLGAVSALAASCARRRRVRAPVAPVPGSVEYGIASWYGYPYHGRRSASGEIYDMEKLTAAHRTLPFGTWVEVQNLSNGRKVQVRVTDRGPFVDGRIIDLSRAAARHIDMLRAGVVRVRLEVIEPPRLPPVAGFYAVQIGAFENRTNAERLRDSLRPRYAHCRVIRRESSSPPWRVLVGEEPSLQAAGALASELRLEFGAAFVVRLDAPASDGL
jgi:rare lipoprotein A